VGFAKRKMLKKNGKRNCRPVFFLMFGVVGVCCNCVEIVEIFFFAVVVGGGGGWCLFISFFFLLFQQYLRHVKYILLEVYAFPLPLFLIHIIFQFINL